MFIDGLLLSGITLNIQREDLPIPDAMQNQTLSVKLTKTQVKAISTLLGLGMRNGELLFYTDEDLNNMICDPNNDTFESEYKSITSGFKHNRRNVKVFDPAYNNPDISEEAWHLTGTETDENGRNFLTISDVNGEDELSQEFTTEDLADLNIERAIHGSNVVKPKDSTVDDKKAVNEVNLNE